jgi:hypothetical protein
LVASGVCEQAVTVRPPSSVRRTCEACFVEHPVQDRTDEELRAMAQAVAARLRAALAA